MGGYGDKRTLAHCWWECKLVQPLWKTVWRFIKSLKIELPYGPAIPLLDIHLEKTIIQKVNMHPNVHCSTIYKSQDTETSEMSIDRGVDKDVVYTYNGILLSHKKEWNVICSNMDGPRDYHTKWSKSDRERQIYDITYMWTLKKCYKWTYLQNRNRLTVFENKFIITKGERQRGRDGGEAS